MDVNLGGHHSPQYRAPLQILGAYAHVLVFSASLIHPHNLFTSHWRVEVGVDTIEFKPLWLIYRAKTTGGRGEAEAQLEAPAKTYVLWRMCGE